MKLRYTSLVFIIALSVASAGPARSQTTDPGTPPFRKGEVIVEIKSGASIDAVNVRVGTTTLQQLYGTNFYRLRTPKGKKEKKFRKRLSKDPDVLSAALNPVVNSITLFGRILSGFPDGFASPGRTIADYNSQQSLSELCFGKPAELEVRSLDRYGRTLAHVVCAGKDANSEQVRRGYAWTYTRYAPPDSPLYALEREARVARRGLWVDSAPVPPWDWRRSRRRPRSASRLARRSPWATRLTCTRWAITRRCRSASSRPWRPSDFAPKACTTRSTSMVLMRRCGSWASR